ncbi:zinc finger domain-containing protein, partial [Anaerospora hongkongensis]
TGKPCFECSAPIQTQRVGGRNAFYCSKCQH